MNLKGAPIPSSLTNFNEIRNLKSKSQVKLWISKQKTQSTCIGRNACKRIALLIGDFPPHKSQLRKQGNSLASFQFKWCISGMHHFVFGEAAVCFTFMNISPSLTGLTCQRKADLSNGSYDICIIGCWEVQKVNIDRTQWEKPCKHSR